MPPERAQKTIHSFHPSEPHEPDEQIVIQRKLERWIDAACFIVNAPPPEAGLLRNVIPALHHPIAMLGENPVRLNEIRVVDEDPMAVNRVHLRIVSEITSRKLQRAGGEKIVAVQIRHDL